MVKTFFYILQQMAVLYMCTRLVVNVSQVYIPMYLTDTLHLTKTYIAIVPLVMYVSGFIVTILTKLISQKISNEVCDVICLCFTNSIMSESLPVSAVSLKLNHCYVLGNISVYQINSGQWY